MTFLGDLCLLGEMWKEKRRRLSLHDCEWFPREKRWRKSTEYKPNSVVHLPLQPQNRTRDLCIKCSQTVILYEVSSYLFLLSLHRNLRWEGLSPLAGLRRSYKHIAQPSDAESCSQPEVTNREDWEQQNFNFTMISGSK